MLLLSFFAILAAFQGPVQINQGGIAGRVNRVDGSGGVPGVQVLLVGPATGPGLNAILSNPLMAGEIAEGASFSQVTITTGDDGAFSFKNLAPGLYTIRARREGYFGAAVSGDPPTGTTVTATVTVAAGQATAEVSLNMARGVTISGRVRDPNGQPMPNLRIAAYQWSYNNGKPVLSATNSKTTDDRGEYRLFWLAPGDYYVGVTPPQPSATDGRPAYARTYYPSAIDARAAQPLRVIDGVDLQNMDISVQPFGTAKVSGQVINALPGTAALPSPLPFSQFFLIPRDSNALTDGTTPTLISARSGRTGQFEIQGVPMGSYDLVTTALDGQNRAFPGRARILVGSQDVENVAITVNPGVEVKVRVTLDGQPVSALPPQPSPTAAMESAGIRLGVATPSLVDRGSAPPAVRIQLRSKESYPAPFDAAAAFNVVNDADGAIVFPHVPESIYTVQVSGSVPANTYVADIREGGVSVYDSGLTVSSGPTGTIEVMLESAGATIKGTVQDAAGNPAINAIVVLIPEASRRQNIPLYKNVRTGTDGSFTITAIPPGKYDLFSWRSVFSVPATSYMNADFLSKYESRGHAVSLSTGATANVQLRTIPTD